ncbi:hypothetical protein KIN20_011116 [Parelaphostrongylus tenuis]|uniref:Uncharacterized protein n=1 Tax=Parelaphostrongylus tenuis TaxID=148309 RepID=A0AAD5M8W8_PARTN|nr:hypothetical protein KIN20_011116 [Parelaphostrongylus tenuis]
MKVENIASVRIGNFTITGFTTLPVAMARTITAEVSTQHPGLGVPSPAPFVRRLVMRAVFKVLQDQGRRALLPDPIIFSILDQLNVTTTFEPLFCNKAVQDLTSDMADPTFDRCVIVGDTVTAICPKDMTQPPEVHDDCNADSRQTFENCRSYLDLKHHHGELVESNVAKCSGPSCSNDSNGSIRITLLRGNCHCLLKF